ncbi:MAG: 30S ribosomal protein S12 methylthiotransferase RimO [Candidatus Magnetomorum sp.]|nr:30S ribosomal protein S12 methylthiotransferase RimO [Candidatus Magnetomorum sp.]
MKTVYIETLGCPKNEVDSEHIQGALQKKNYTCVSHPKAAEIIIINTCGFIEAAASESIERILELSEYKEQNTCQKLIVTGCLIERYASEIKKELPEVDIFLGTGAFHQIPDIIQQTNRSATVCTPKPENAFGWYETVPRSFKADTKTVYLRIAEGCSLHCTYCIIPKLRGPYRSRPFDNILKEFQFYLDADVKEIILVAQDTAAYGKDLSASHNLSDLLTRMSEKIEQKKAATRIRILYVNPQHIDDHLIDTFKTFQAICPYIDMPIQHANDQILKQMGRPYRQDDLKRLIEKIRTTIPEIVLRTTLLVGFPGEKEYHYQDLMNFVHEIEFDHLGVFDYSDGDDLPSHHLKDHVLDEEKEDRRHRLMICQAEISYKRQQHCVGQVYEVLTEHLSEDDPPLREGRTYFQAPEIDGMTLISGKPVPSGEFHQVRITSAMHYDLIGEVL